MQHVLRCWEKQSDSSEYKKTLRRPGLCPGSRWGSLQRSHKPPSWWGGAGCPLPKNLTPALGPLGLASPTATPKLVPTPLDRRTDRSAKTTSHSACIARRRVIKMQAPSTLH